jgi:hypothetical protein
METLAAVGQLWSACQARGPGPGARRRLEKGTGIFSGLKACPNQPGTDGIPPL